MLFLTFYFFNEI